jgi:hypothetical protein
VLENQMQAMLSRAGLVLAERSLPDSDGGSGVARLEYQSLAPVPRRVLLDVCHLTEKQTITAALWSPEDLRRASPRVDVTSIARGYQVWHYTGAVAAADLVPEIVETISAWLA